MLCSIFTKEKKKKNEVMPLDAETLSAHLKELLVVRDARYEQRFQEQEKLTIERDRRYDQRFLDIHEAQEKALTAANVALCKVADDVAARFHTVNEFRGSLADQQRALLTRSEFLTAETYVSSRIDEVVKSVKIVNDMVIASQGSGTGLKHILGVFISLAAVGVALFATFRR